MKDLSYSFGLLSHCLLNVCSHIAYFFGCCFICIFASLLDILKTLRKVLFCFLKFRSLIACGFLYAFSSIFSGFFEMLFGWLCFWFGISSYNFLCLFFCFLRQFSSFLTYSLFGLLKAFFKRLLGLFCFGLDIGARDFTDFISYFIKNVAGSFLDVFPSLSSGFLNVFHGGFSWLHSNSLLDLFFSFFQLFLCSLFCLSRPFFNLLGTFFNVFFNLSGTFFNVLFGLVGFLLRFRWYQFMDFLWSDLIDSAWDLFKFLPTLWKGWCYIFNNSLRLFFDFFLPFFKFFLSPFF